MRLFKEQDVEHVFNFKAAEANFKCVGCKVFV